ncbi:malate synthase [Streptomyces sp. LP05-1]|uniref:malate synthase n=1 Tax=Streptomyces pyxinae TaxID=2970734 RepID=A0ABT2CJ84_9ACTN|nr:malate synthase [Streptomyces sp. LP05-1]MCS0637467.1 malate synthase [Streptomyces sp. LP05-1]
MTITATSTGHVQVLGAPGDRFDEILTPAALGFLARLDAAFTGRRERLLAERRRRAARLASGMPLDFSPATAAVRAERVWRVAPVAPGLADRRVEITAPPERRAAAGALRSGAGTWVADLADATAPTWENVIGGQLVLREAVLGRIGPAGPGATAADRTATVLVRPRGWHLTEDHLVVDGRPLPAALVDFGLYVFHCARPAIEAGRGPYFSLGKVENRSEARLWNDVFLLAQESLGLARGTIRATVVIDTVTAAFEMEEILHELREHSAGLALGHPDYLFSLIKNFAHRPDFSLPDRARITATAPFLRARADLLVRTCHRRGAHAIGAPADRVPGADPAAHEAALAAVRLDKEREAEDGFDGSGVTGPELVPVCRAAFTGVLGDRPHQIERLRDDLETTAAALLSVRRTAGPPSDAGVRTAVAATVRYFGAWLRGQGTVELHGLRLDAAGAELARAQVWQWLRHGAVGPEQVREILDEELAALGAAYPWAALDEIRALFEETVTARELPPFFTAAGYAARLVRRAAEPV